MQTRTVIKHKLVTLHYTAMYRDLRKRCTPCLWTVLYLHDANRSWACVWLVGRRAKAIAGWWWSWWNPPAGGQRLSSLQGSLQNTHLQKHSDTEMIHCWNAGFELVWEITKENISITKKKDGKKSSRNTPGSVWRSRGKGGQKRGKWRILGGGDTEEVKVDKGRW